MGGLLVKKKQAAGKRQCCDGLDVKSFGLAVGLTWGLGVFCLAIFSIFGWGTLALQTLASMYVGTKPSITGAILGGVYGLIDGTIGGVLIALFYNALSKCSCRRQSNV